MPADPIVNDHYDVLENGKKFKLVLLELCNEYRRRWKRFKGKGWKKINKRPLMALLKSYAKINLSLSVKRKWINGLQDISYFCQMIYLTK